MGSAGFHSKVRVVGFFTIQKEAVSAIEGLSVESNITMEGLRLAQQDQGRIVLVTEVFEVHLVTTEAFNVPRHAN